MMRNFFLAAAVLYTFSFVSCNSSTAEQQAVQLTPEHLIQKNIDSLKSICKEGDVIARMNDNLVSYHVRNFNSTDRSFSHAGVVVMHNGKKMVCNIDANEPGIDTVRYDPIDSFINPKENFLCGLYRYNFSDAEREKFVAELNSYHERKVHFDRRFDLSDDSLIYCSEMIAKSIIKATNGRIVLKDTTTPKAMLTVMTKFFQKEAPKNTPPKKVRQVIEQRRYIPIDALYMVPQCTELMRFKLKHFPGT